MKKAEKEKSLPVVEDKSTSSKLVRALPDSIFRVSSDGCFNLEHANEHCNIPKHGNKFYKAQLQSIAKELDGLQQKLYAESRHSVLCIFQAIDAAGKDSTIRNVFQRLNPAGFQVFSFKSPSTEELKHDFLWRTAKSLPEKGRIGVFNRSYYEEVLVVKVHPEYIAGQRLDGPDIDAEFWSKRYRSIRDHEAHLVDNGTVVLKFWLNVSKGEQKKRFLSRIDEPAKNWKFSSSDLAERQHWDDYMNAYEQCIRETSTEKAPWYVIPADNKPYMRYCVAEIVQQTLQALEPQYPVLKKKEKQLLVQYAEQLHAERLE